MVISVTKGRTQKLPQTFKIVKTYGHDHSLRSSWGPLSDGSISFTIHQFLWEWNGPGSMCSHGASMCSHGASWHNLCWFHSFINSYWVYKEVIRHQRQYSRLYSYWICTKFQVNSPSGYKMCPANPDKLWPLWPWKVGQIKNPGIMSCIFIRCIHDNNLELI
jgi:hypothetical protein